MEECLDRRIYHQDNKNHSRSIAVAGRQEVCDLLTKVAEERKEEVTNSINFNRRWVIKQNNEILMGSTSTSSLTFINNHDPKGTVWPQEWKKNEFNNSMENPPCKQEIEKCVN